MLKLHQGPLPSQPAHLPPTNTNNHLDIEPLSLLDWKWDTSASPPTKLVLVQWSGLALEDITWEAWDALPDSYNLEDKVNFPEGGDVSDISPATSSANASRPKRCSRRPTHLNDYI